jgi:hypothetical protein
MTGERTMEGWELRLRSRDRGRYVSGAFLLFWLCGWAVGESIVLWLLIKGGWALLTGNPPEPGRAPLDPGPTLLVGLFLLVWITLWTIGGIAAGMELLRLLWGEDRIRVASGRLSVTWIRGPFQSTRDFERDTIRKIVIAGRHGHLSLQAARKSIELSGLGTRPEREQAALDLRRELTLPEGDIFHGLSDEWEEVITAEGERALVANLATRRTQARVASMVTLFLAAITLMVGLQIVHQWQLVVPVIVLLALTIALTVGTLWLARGRWEWRIGSGRVTLRKRYGGSLKDVFEARRLLLDMDTDSDGDTWYGLYGVTDTAPARTTVVHWRTSQPKNRRQIARVMNDSTQVRALATWLAQASGLELDDHTTSHAREVHLAELRALLENSGRFGKWAAKVVDRLSEKQKRAG